VRRSVTIILALVAGLVFSAGLYLAGVGSGFAIADIRGRSAATVTAPAAALPARTPCPGVSEPAAPGPTSAPTTAPTAPPPTATRSAGPPSATEEAPEGEPFLLLGEVWSILSDEFYGDFPDVQALDYAAIRGLLGALGDEDTTFIEPDSAAIMGEDATGELEGIGAYVGLDQEGRLQIIRPFEDGPAALAGLISGDLVLSVDDVPLSGRSLYEAIALIRGPAGTEVRLLIERAGMSEPFETIVTRARVAIPTTTARMLDQGVGYMRLHSFNASATEALERSLRDLLSQGAVGVVLDVRQNPGGWLDQAIGVADLFLADGVILVERWSDGGEDVYRAREGDAGEHVPLVVLVDGGSASASEIVGGALQDNQRALLVGEVTYGKGSVQRPHTLSDGSELRVTIAAWFTPDGRAIHAQGLTPDFEVAWPDGADLEAGNDPQLNRAVELVLEQVE
jgi:carboxyl-terminal processing protease